jgi:hypothetical protein
MSYREDNATRSFVVIFHAGYFLGIMREDALCLPLLSDGVQPVYLKGTVKGVSVYEYSGDIKECDPKEVEDGAQFWVSWDEVSRSKVVHGYPIDDEMYDVISNCWSDMFKPIFDEKPEYGYITMYSPTRHLEKDMMMGLSIRGSATRSSVSPLNDHFSFFEYGDSNALAQEYQASVDAEASSEVPIRCGNLRLSFVPPKNLKYFNPETYEHDDMNQYARMVHDALSREGMIVTSLTGDDANDARYVVAHGKTGVTILDGVYVERVVNDESVENV